MIPYYIEQDRKNVVESVKRLSRLSVSRKQLSKSKTRENHSTNFFEL